MMRVMCLLALLILSTAIARAQEVATLVADTVRVAPDAQLVAEGAVEVFYDGVRLRARRITYDQAAERLDIEGPITLDDGDGVLVVADQAQLDADLRNGILRSARMVLDQQLQLAATQVARVDGRYTQLSNTVASSCEICASNPTPTWEIRARRIIHDRQERLLYFDRATFRLLGVPVAYFPKLRLPDPTRTRVTGFLLPRIRSTSRLGTGVKQPLFITVGDHADLTLTPYVSSSTRTLEGVFRQEFARGTLGVAGALTRDDLIPDATRHYLFATGEFDLPREFTLQFDIESVSDEAYLIDYDYADVDRLESGISVFRARRNDLARFDVTTFETLRDTEQAIEDQLPGYYATVGYERAFAAGAGEIVLSFDAANLSRDSDLPELGRDTSRVGAAAEYRRGWLWPMGVVGQARGGLSGSVYDINQDPRFGDRVSRLSPFVSTELRLPLQRSDATGMRHLIEPVVQLAWSDVDGDAVPNEDSILVEFDEGNLFALSRFPGEDRIEVGYRANLGVRYTLSAPERGFSLGAVVGRVLRDTGSNTFGQGDPETTISGFTEGSGLSERRSDWLAAGQLRLGERLSLTARTLVDEDFEVTKNEARVGFADTGYRFETSYVFLNADPVENRPRDTHELTLDAAARLSRHWTGSVEARYDFDQDRAQSSGVGLQYRSECLTVDLSVARRFTSTANVDPSTDFGIGVSLGGVGAGATDNSYRKTCKG